MIACTDNLTCTRHFQKLEAKLEVKARTSLSTGTWPKTYELLLRVYEDCFYYSSQKNNVIVLCGSLKVRSIILTEMRDRTLLIVVACSTFLEKKSHVKKEKG